MIEQQAASVHVQTVTGPVDVADLGMTLTHEHLYADFSAYVWNPDEAWKAELGRIPVSAQIAWALREDSFFHPDSCRLDDVNVSVEELGAYRAAGGHTVVKVTNAGIGRDPLKLREISERTDLNVVMGSTWYIGSTHDESLRRRSVDDLASELLAEVDRGVADTGVRPGVLGELGISEGFHEVRTEVSSCCRPGAGGKRYSSDHPPSGVAPARQPGARRDRRGRCARIGGRARPHEPMGALP